MRASLAAALILVLGVALAPPRALAEPDPQATAEREAAREARILEYLARKEARLARREMAREAKHKNREREEQQRFEAALQGTEPGLPGGPAPGASDLPRPLARAQDSVRRSQLAKDPTVQLWLERIDRQAASAHELAAFANFLSENGLSREALAYYGVAIHLEENDPLLWVNLGTIHRQLGELGPAASAYEAALSVDPNHALAHYNLGAVLDERGKYADAIEEYKLALSLDPSLGDPSLNPQAANNDRLTAVRLMLYQEQAGSLGMPLVDVQTPSKDRPAPPQK
jgi:tetratricopeptide (TPR) repeat protein